MEKTQIKDFTKGNIAKQVFVFSLPLFLSNLMQILYNMADMIIVGNKLGKAGMSAVAVGGDVSGFLTFVAMGFSNAGQVLIARYIGGGKRDKISEFVGTMSGFLIVCSLVISGVGLVFRNEILNLMNTPSQAYGGAMSYSSICMAGLVFIYGYNIVSAVMRGMGDSRHPFVFISIAAVLNVVLDIIFVIFLDFGPGGAAFATVISQGVSFIACVVFLFKNKEQFRLTFRKSDFVKWNMGMLGELVKLGCPMAIKTASVQFSKMFVNSWINSYGVAVSAFAGIANKIAGISNLVSSSLNTAGSTMVGQNLAAREYDRVKCILKNLGIITVAVASVFSIAICLFPGQIFGIFTGDADVLEISVFYIPIAVLQFYGGAGRAVANALINGSGNYKINFVTAILDGIVLRIGLSVVFGIVLGMKHYGFWLGDAVAGFTPFWIGAVFFVTGMWRRSNQKQEG